MRTNSRLRLTRHERAFFVVVAFSWLSFGFSPIYAQTDLNWNLPTYPTTNNGDWFLDTNWTPPGPPTPTQSATVGNAPTATVAAPGAVANQLVVNATPPATGQVIVTGANA